MENNGVIEKAIQLAMEYAEMKTRLCVLYRMVAAADKDCEGKNYGASLYTKDIRLVMGWNDD